MRAFELAYDLGMYKDTLIKHRYLSISVMVVSLNNTHKMTSQKESIEQGKIINQSAKIMHTPHLALFFQVLSYRYRQIYFHD